MRRYINVVVIAKYVTYILPFYRDFYVGVFYAIKWGVFSVFFAIFALILFTMMQKFLIVLTINLLSLASLFGQVSQDYFMRPFEFELFLSGNFGELRSNHFHAGLDFKTQGVVGKPISVVADGYIARAKVQYGGYGRALYVVHDGGYMTVYGHLDSFPEAVDEAVREKQYGEERYAVDLFFAPGRFRVKKGDVLACAGNAGYSFGPHLHFEVRSLDGEELYNPLRFYKKLVADRRPPVAQAVAVYPKQGAGVVEGFASSLVRKVAGETLADTLNVWGKVGFGLKAIDYMTGTHNKYGVYEVELYVDDSLRFSSRMDNVSFSENRLINAWADYERLSAGEGWFLRSFLLPNNPLRAVQADAADGWVDVCEERLYKVEYRLRDYHGNTGGCSFVVRGVRAEVPVPILQGQHLSWYLTNEVVGAGFSLKIPRGALFDDAWVSVRDSITPSRSPVYILGDKKIPLWHNAKLALEIPSHLLPLADKCYIERVTGKGGSAVGGKSYDGFVEAEISVLDSYAVAVDTVAPLLKPVNEKKWGRDGKIAFLLSEKESGLGTYKCYIDGRFVLFEYNSKNKKFLCNLRDEKVAHGFHRLKFVVTDKVGNTSVVEKEFKY